MAKSKKYYSTPEQLIANVQNWISDNRPLTNEECVLWLEDKYGASLVALLKRTNYTARLVVRRDDGEHEIIVSLPRKQIANNVK